MLYKSLIYSIFFFCWSRYHCYCNHFITHYIGWQIWLLYFSDRETKQLWSCEFTNMFTYFQDGFHFNLLLITLRNWHTLAALFSSFKPRTKFWSQVLLVGFNRLMFLTKHTKPHTCCWCLYILFLFIPQQLLTAFHTLSHDVVYQNLTSPEQILSIFPESFHSNLKNLITKIILENRWILILLNLPLDRQITVLQKCSLQISA